MVEIDVDEVQEIDFEDGNVRVTFKDGSSKIYRDADAAEAAKILNHWTPPTA